MSHTTRVAQTEFSPLLFDTLFGLILFFSLESYLTIRDPAHFILYLLSTIVLIDWWLAFKAADDLFGEEVSNPTADLLFGIVYLIFLNFFVLATESFDLTTATVFLIAVFVIDLLWSLIWRYVGTWDPKNSPAHIRAMEHELDSSLRIGITMLVLYGALFFLMPVLTPLQYVIAFVLLYAFFIVLTYRTKIIDLRFF